MSRSYAILGLKPGVSLAEVRRRYRFLARRWHPDRHGADARNQAEAGAEMGRINEAYRAIIEERAPEPARPAPPAPAGRRLSREEIDAMAASIGSDGPVDWMLSAIGWVGSTVEAGLAILLGIWLTVRVVGGVWRGDYSVFREHPEVIVLMVLLGVVLIRELWLRRRLLHPASRDGDA